MRDRALTSGYRLLVKHDSEIQLYEVHASIDTARGKAEMVREELMAKGWRTES